MAGASSVEANWTDEFSHRNDLTDMTLEKFKMWTIPSLIPYLKEREWRVSGNKEHLVTRAFSVWEIKAAVVISKKGKGY